MPADQHQSPKISPGHKPEAERHRPHNGNHQQLLETDLRQPVATDQNHSIEANQQQPVQIDQHPSALHDEPPPVAALQLLEAPNLETAIRCALTQDDEVIPEVVSEVQTAFQRAILFLSLDEAPSTARQRKILDKLMPEDFRSGESMDDAVRVRVGMHLHSGIFDLFTNHELPDDRQLAQAIAEARISLDPVSRGRPPGTESRVARQLARELARIWHEYSGKRPTRSVVVDEAGSGHREGGAFHRFIEGVLALAPAELRKPRKGAIPKVDHFVRLAQTELDAAYASGSEAEAMGLLNEEDWLGKPSK